MKDYDRHLLPFARKLREDMTRQERHLWYDFLRDYPAKFRKQQPLGPYIVDFYCHQKKLVIELDGGQHYETTGLESDRQRDAFFAAAGVRVLRFSNLDIDQNFDGVCAAIRLEEAPL